MAVKRIYVVSGVDSIRLIEAGSKAQAISFVAKSSFEGRVASQSDLVKFIMEGVLVEGSGDPEDLDSE